MLLVLNMLLTSLSIVSLFLNTILLYEKREIFTILRMFIKKKKEYPHFFKWGMNFSPGKAIFLFPIYYNKKVYSLN